jgi:prepilin-type N-terminal cleavage/methylation domain-containing protein
MQHATSDIKVRYASRQGFTIVELLIVVVVIAILAAITIVAYNGITKSANNASIQDTLSQAARKLEIYKTNDPSSLYPVTLASAGLNLTSSGGVLYVYSPSTDSTQYCLASSQSGRTYFITSTSSKPQPGICNGTTGTTGTGDVAIDGTSTASTATYSIYNGTTPGTTQVVYTDGGGSLIAGNRFYTLETTGVYVKGLRIYNPASADSTFLNLGITAYAYMNDWTGGQVNAPVTFGTSPVATKTYSGTRTAGTWTDILFDTPFLLPKISSASGASDLVTLAVQFTGGNDYVYVLPGPAGGGALDSIARSGNYLAENSIGREANSVEGGSGGSYYGIDMLFSPVTP